MQAEESNPPRKNPRARVIWLVGVHIQVGLLLGAVTVLTLNEGDRNLVFAIFLGLVFSQTSLLGIWGGAGRSRWWIRLIGVLVGVAYLGPELGICIDHFHLEIILIVAFATMMVAGVLLLTRCFGFRIRLHFDQDTPATEMQFSIRHMMILTLVVACWLASAKWQHRYLDLDDWPNLAAQAIPFATVGLAAVWGVLGTKRPLIGIVVLSAVAVGAGYGFAWYVAPGPRFDIWITATLIEALSLTVSLLLVRSWGYRLRRRAARQAASHPTGIKE